MEYENRIKVFGDIYFDVPVSTAERPIETLFQELPKEDQYWRRQTDYVINKQYPNIFFDYDPHLPPKSLCRLNAIKTMYIGDKLYSLSVEDTQALIKLVQREVDRMKRGVFMMNNGVRIYLPGCYFGALQYGKMIGVETNGGYGDHRRYQREFACQRQKCIDDTEIDGFYLQKIKKAGITQLINLFYVIESITNKQFTAASMSKNHDTAKSANFKYYSYALKNVPKILLPSIEQKGWSNAVQKIQIRCSNPELSFETNVLVVSSQPDSLDGLPPLKRICLSEMPKMDDAEQILTKSREQARIQKTKIGIIEIESYPPEDDTKSFRYCRDLHTKDCMDLDEKGYPKNRLIPLYMGLLEATSMTHDIYGDPDILKALQMEEKERAKCDTPAKLQARKRQYHMNVKESWESGGGGSIYNNLTLAEQMAIIQEKYKFGELNYISGNLEWSAGRMSPVRFLALTHDEIMQSAVAKWRIFCTLDYLAKKGNLCFKMPRKIKVIKKERIELLQPPDDEFNAGGCDPVDYAYVTEMGKKQSKNAFVIKDVEGNLLAAFHNRSEDPDDDIDEFIKGLILFGVRALVEGNRKTAVTTLENEGMNYFMLIRHINGQIVPYGQGMNIKHISSSKDLKSLYISLNMKVFKNKIYQMKCVEIIEQHMDFDPDKTQEYDLAIADSLCNVSVDAVQTWVNTKNNKSEQFAHLGVALSHVVT